MPHKKVKFTRETRGSWATWLTWEISSHQWKHFNKVIILYISRNWSSNFEEEDFKILSRYFCYFVIISPWKSAGPFIRTNLNPLHPRMLCAEFGWNWLIGFGEDYWNLSMYFRYFILKINYLPVEKGGGPSFE